MSDGTIDLSADHRAAAIDRAHAYGFSVITEVGKKIDGTDLDPQTALRQIEADLEAGAVKVIIEGRESGKGAGIFDGDGRVKGDEMEQIAQEVSRPERLMWETPLKAQQEAMILRFGPNVNLGNVPPDEVMALEALRRGLRGDTLRTAVTRMAQS